jgi:hypothetical protein
MLHEASGIADEVITARGYRSIDGVDGYVVLKQLGFSKPQARNTPGLLLPLWTTDGQQPLTVYRSDTPRVTKDGDPLKYELPYGSSTRVDCPPPCQPHLGNPHVPLWLTEGQKKADALASRGACAIAQFGVHGWKGKNAPGGTTVLADFDHIAWNDRQVRIVFDSDLLIKPAIRQAVTRLTEHLNRRQAQVSIAYLPTHNGAKVGVDDFLAAGHTLQDLEGLLDAPKMQPQAAPPSIELLAESPPTLSRLLAWINGHAYAVTWLPLKITETEVRNRKGEIERVAQPQPRHERCLFVMRDDGVLYGDAVDPKVQPLAALGIDIAPMDAPPHHLLWTTAGITAYLHGQRPDPARGVPPYRQGLRPFP